MPLLNNDCPGMQVPPVFRLLWLGTGVILFALANVNLSYLVSHPGSTSIPVVAASTSDSIQTVATTQDDAETEVLALCGLADVRCDSEKIAAVVAPTSTVHAPSAVPATMSDKMSTLRQVCARHNLGEQCAKDLYAMAWHESRFDNNAEGDFYVDWWEEIKDRKGNIVKRIPHGHYRSYGAFQIQVKMHKVSKDFARDFEKAANWSLERMIGNGYAKGLRTYAVLRHNGSGPMAQKYARTVISYANTIK